MSTDSPASCFHATPSQANDFASFKFTPALAKHLALDDYAAAAELIRQAIADPLECISVNGEMLTGDLLIHDIRGVCLMRIGKIKDAVQLYRSLILAPGTTDLRQGMPPETQRNYATSLLMSGRPSGALDLLRSPYSDESLANVRLRSAIMCWEQTLPWWQRLDWKLNRTEPKRCYIPLDFEPGEFRFNVTPPSPHRPNRNSVDVAA